MPMDDPSRAERFEETTKANSSPTLLGELWDFLRHNKKWWLLPIFIVLLLFGVLIFLSGTGAAPFIYTFH